MSANPASSVRPPARPSASNSGITDPGYALMRQHRKRANEYLGRALEIDESGHGEHNLFSAGHQLSTVLSVHVGDKSAAIDFYSKAVTELENGVSCTVNVKGQCQWQIKTQIHVDYFQIDLHHNEGHNRCGQGPILLHYTLSRKKKRIIK